ncbi:glycosyltransferase family A protein [Salinispora pacifica]|uniref:glycosyltransferase family A protein n=1 Tax=Salinispora pacifica TaxID=351187 RepID=UPI00036F997D|nr:glycosyltransferase family A protein [Salinispora pacifica]
MNPTPLVSVIVPSYNYAASLEVCLRAVLDQTYPAIEVLVVDDHSTDDSAAVACSLGVRVIALPDNGGCGRARNVGVANSAGEILFFVDADVAMAPDAVAEAVAVLTAEPQVGAVCGIEDPEPLLHDTAIARYRGLQYHHWSASGEGEVTFLFPAMCAIRRSVYDQVGPFNPALKQTEEVDYGYRLSRRHRLLLTSRVRGRHDHDHELLPLLRKLFHRARLRIPLYARARRFATGFETAARAWGSLLAAATLPALLLAALAGPVWLLAPAALFGASITVDRAMYALVLRRRGVRFLLFFVAVHFMVNVTITTGVGVGVLQWLTSRPFRRLYDSTFPVEAPA